MVFTEESLSFPCCGERLLGVLARPEQPAETAILILVGGLQYRVGSHRQFVLLSRRLAAAGYPCLRFDFRGMGDSSGETLNFDEVREDVVAALDTLQATLPSVRRVVLWGLCDAASAALLYWHASGDRRVCGMILLNPWVRSAHTLAQTRVRHYYLHRLGNFEFWKKLTAGKVNFGQSFSELTAHVAKLLFRSDGPSVQSFQQRMHDALLSFPGKIQFILSGKDYTAREFLLWLEALPEGMALLKGGRINCDQLEEADHTFSTNEWRLAVEDLTLNFVERAGR